MHQTSTGTNKNEKNKPLDAPNIDRHQKNNNISSNYSEVDP